MTRGRQNFQLPAGAAFTAWKGPLQNKQPRWTKHALEGRVHRDVTQGLDRDNVVGYKRVSSPEIFEYLDYLLRSSPSVPVAVLEIQ